MNYTVFKKIKTINTFLGQEVVQYKTDQIYAHCIQVITDQTE